MENFIKKNWGRWTFVFVSKITFNLNNLLIFFSFQESLQDAYDNLCEDFTGINKELVELQESSQAIEELSAGTDGKSGKHISGDSAEKLASNKDKQAKLEIQKKQVAERMEDCLKKMDQKKLSVIEPEGYEDTIPASSKSGKKSKK